MWTKKQSAQLTNTLLWVACALVGAAFFIAPPLVRRIYGYSLHSPKFYFTCAMLYVAFVLAFVALYHLHELLENITRSSVFTLANAAHLRAISYYSFGECAVFLVLSICYPLSLVVSFAACFLGLTLRVLKNVFDEAVALQEESDSVI